MNQLYKLIFLLFFSAGTSAYATHIIGGELIYTCTGGNNYDITLILYRDCASGGALFDNPASLGIYNSAGELVDNVSMFSPLISIVPLVSPDPCIAIPPELCVEQGIYTVSITLPDDDDTYTIAYQRCCRNPGILNIVLPGATGSTWWHDILPESVVACNSSPQFNFYPPNVICVGTPLVVDHSATDPDGDSLVYKFITPFAGATEGAPMPVPPPAPPYDNVVYTSGYSFDVPVDALPILAIDPETGILTGTPTVAGRYVVGIGVEEYRDGVLLGVHFRDFQFNVTECLSTVAADIGVDGVPVADVYLNCEDYIVEYSNFSFGATSYFWSFGDGTTSEEFEPVHVYSDTGTYNVVLIANPGFVCADTTFLTVKIYATLTADFTFNAECSGTPVDFTDLSISTGSGDIVEWEWNFGDGSSSTLSDPEYEYAEGGSYAVSLAVTTDKGCVSVKTLPVSLLPGPDVDFAVNNICLDETAEFDNLTSFAAGTTGTGYTWNFGDGLTSNDDSPSHDYTVAGTYTVTLIASSSNGCTDTMQHTLIVGLLPDANAGPDATVGYLESYTLNGSGTGTFSWSPALLVDDPTSARPVTRLGDTQTFVLTVTSPDGCIGYDTVTIFITQRTIIIVPTAFSPNEDGLNDELFILYHNVNKLLEYTIYNRWGELIFTTNDITKGWDGTYKGNEQDMGTFIYIVRAIDMDNKEVNLKGDVMLVR